MWSSSKQPDSPFLPDKISEDWIGPPDTLSKIRPVRQHVPEHETRVERLLRERQASVMQWNHNYWRKHNKAFKKERRQFVEAQPESPVSDDRMAEFYRRFMEQHQSKHRRYNVQWYGHNCALLALAALASPVRLARLFRLIR